MTGTMAILREKTIWKRPRVAPVRTDKLNRVEQANVRKALRRLRVEFGSCEKLGVALKKKGDTISRSMRTYGKPTLGMALAIARLTGARIDDVLSGAFLRYGVCPTCGRCDDQSR
jgi:hypothetical protein